MGGGEDVGSCGDDGRRDEHALFDVPVRGGRNLEQLPRDPGDAGGKGPALFAVHGQGIALLDDAGGGGKVDRASRTQFGRAMVAELGIDMIPAYSPEARGRSERAFRTHQGRLPMELALAGITDMESANRYLRETYMPAFNAEFERAAREPGSGFVPLTEPGRLENILCEIHERQVGRDNCVKFEGLALQLPSSRHRPHYMRVRVKVRRHMDGSLSVWHGPRLLQRYGTDGRPLPESLREAAWDGRKSGHRRRRPAVAALPRGGVAGDRIPVRESGQIKCS